MVLKLRSGFPRQLSVIKENRRCSILFHLLVPGGRWQTVMGIRNSFASLCSSIFHRRRRWPLRSEEHTSELQSRLHLVCRLLLEKKKTFQPLCAQHDDRCALDPALT